MSSLLYMSKENRNCKEKNYICPFFLQSMYPVDVKKMIVKGKVILYKLFGELSSSISKTKNTHIHERDIIQIFSADATI